MSMWDLVIFLFLFGFVEIFIVWGWLLVGKLKKLFNKD